MGKGEGKGKGKGGCGEFLANVGDAIQGVAACICCCLISGPLATIAGIWLIVSGIKNQRGQFIDEFNVAVAAWDNGAVDGWNDANNTWTYSAENSCGAFSPGPMPLELVNDPDNLGPFEEPRRDTFDAFESAYYAVESTPDELGTLSPNNTDCDITVNYFFNGQEVGTVVSKLVTDRSESFTSLQCPLPAISSTDTMEVKAQKENDAIRTCQAYCSQAGGQPSGTTQQNFSCRLQAALSAVCIRVESTGDSWTVAQNTLPGRSGAIGSGCFLTPFSSQWSDSAMKSVRELSGPLELAVSVRSDQDPYLYFLDITQGFQSFGPTRGDLLKAGFALLAIGILITTLVCLCCCCIYRFAMKIARGDRERPEDPVGGTLHDVAEKYGSRLPGVQAQPPDKVDPGNLVDNQPTV